MSRGATLRLRLLIRCGRWFESNRRHRAAGTGVGRSRCSDRGRELAHHDGISSAAMLNEIYSVFAVICGIGICVAVIYFLIEGRDDRAKEEEARENFDTHGHWPDEA